MKPILKYTDEKRPRKRFRASDSGKLAIDIMLEFQGVEYTNPAQWNDTLKWSAGKGVELQMLKILKQNGIVPESFDQEKNETVSMQREGIEIGMQFDALTNKCTLKTEGTHLPNNYDIEISEGEPIEIKSINNKNSFDINDYVNGKPRENYVMQLAMYMDYLGKEQGHLFASSIDGLNTFWFVCKKTSDGIYTCGQVTVDLTKEYRRFAEIWKVKNNLVTDWYQECGRYKIPVSEVKWNEVSTGNISKARNGEKVIGDPNQWHIMYSPYRDLILMGQGVERGYTPEETEQIKVITKGYSAKAKL